jgi:hypothetical protein
MNIPASRPRYMTTPPGAQQNTDSANFMLPHCKLFLAGTEKETFTEGLCAGSITAFAFVGRSLDGKARFCFPKGATHGRIHNNPTGSAWETSGAPQVPTPEAALRSVVLPLPNAFVKPIAVLKTRSSGPKIASAAPSRKNPLLQTEYGRFQRPAWIAPHAGNIHGSVRSGFGA